MVPPGQNLGCDGVDLRRLRWEDRVSLRSLDDSPEDSLDPVISVQPLKFEQPYGLLERVNFLAQSLLLLLKLSGRCPRPRHATICKIV
jgi:hypothetical protein